MTKSALKLYAQAALDRKQSNGVFKADVHQHLAQKLNEEFPGSDFTEKNANQS